MSCKNADVSGRRKVHSTGRVRVLPDGEFRFFRTRANIFLIAGIGANRIMGCITFSQ
jgi:hypothetical protein